MDKPERAAAQAASQISGSLLVVDDEPTVLELLPAANRSWEQTRPEPAASVGIRPSRPRSAPCTRRSSLSKDNYR
ncbi:hypothetical protein ACFWFF_25040, partial [Streptomyces sp. NPDC060223]|uniref:hypothetical protein n=1 Tax=Streptomyces sp. NPDC060223 TaxID=3347077 RepID=UPI003665DF7A